MKGRTEWERQTETLKMLAGAYGTTFPFPDGGSARRMSDKETAAAAAGIADAANRFKSDLDKDKTLAKPAKDAAKKDVEALVKQADTVKSRTTDGKPTGADTRLLLDHVAKVQAFVAAHPTVAMANWQSVQASVGKLRQAFGMTP